MLKGYKISVECFVMQLLSLLIDFVDFDLQFFSTFVGVVLFKESPQFGKVSDAEPFYQLVNQVLVLHAN